MSTEGYDSSKDGFESAKDTAKETFENVKDTAEEAAKDFNEEYQKFANSKDNKRILAGVMGIVFGGLGVHKFILGYTNEGIILAAIFVLSFPLMCIIIGAFTIYIPIIIGFIEGIIYLTKSEEEFYETYQANKKAWF